MDMSPRSPPMTSFGLWRSIAGTGSQDWVPSSPGTMLKPFLFSLPLLPFLPCLFWAQNILGDTGLCSSWTGLSTAGLRSQLDPFHAASLGAPHRDQASCTHTEPPCTCPRWLHRLLFMQPATSQVWFSPCTSSCCLISMFDTICISPSSWLSQQPPHHME